ncbi:MAG: hypothetical protein PVH29_04735 [Candidatus Zixiibacteriota bacterium]|jgi:hypothetical protein
MADDERLDILKKLEQGEITAAQAEEMLDGLEADTEVEAAPEADAFTDITQWSPDGPITELTVEGFVGRVNARTGDQVLVVATARARAKDEAAAREAFDKVELTFDEEDGRARAKADITKSIFSFFRGDKISVDFDVTVPADVVLKANIGTGPVRTDGVTSVRANLGQGKVETDAADVDVNLGNGKVFSRGARELTINGGNIRATVDDAGGLETFKFNAGNGHVDARIPDLPANADYSMHFGNGHVNVEFGRKPTNCRINVDSLAGNVQADFPFEKEGTRMLYIDGEEKAQIKITGAHCRVEMRLKEE